jgi:di/tripeptidase
MSAYPNLIRHTDLDITDDLITVLQDLFRIYSPSRREHLVMDYAADYLRRLGDFTVTVDEHHNVMAVRGTPENGFYPLLNAHGDTVQDDLDEFLTHNVRYDAEKNILHGRDMFMLGCDDKAGMALILIAAKYSDCPLKVLFTVEEEIGCNGIKSVDPSFYDDVAFAITLDRKGSGDIIDTYGGRLMAPKAFVNALMEIGGRFGHELKPSHGSFADTFYISNYCIAVNMSTGYYNAHSTRDYIDIGDAMKILETVSRCITEDFPTLENIAVNYEIPPAQDRYGSRRSSSSSSSSFGVWNETSQSSLFDEFGKSRIYDPFDDDPFVNIPQKPKNPQKSPSVNVPDIDTLLARFNRKSRGGEEEEE